jgi:hypothetical protein
LIVCGGLQKQKRNSSAIRRATSSLIGCNAAAILIGIPVDHGSGRPRHPEAISAVYFLRALGFLLRPFLLFSHFKAPQLHHIIIVVFIHLL